MEDGLLSLIISLIAGVVSWLLNTIIFTPILLAVSWGVKEKYSANFWFRAVVFSQLVFWGSFFWLVRTDEFEAMRYTNNGTVFFLNCFLVIIATAINMRICLKLRDLIKGRSSDASHQEDALDKTLDAGSTAKDVLEKIAKIGGG
jgi:hypothetical protein